MSEELPTKEKLARALEATGNKRLKHMIKRAREGFYDDYESPDPLVNIHMLVNDLLAYGETELAKRAINGEFDGTKEEAERWRNSLEGMETFDDPLLVEEARELFKKITGIDPLADDGGR
jgi:hypothetical protein